MLTREGSLPFPVTSFSGGSEGVDSEQINGIYVCRHLFSQIRTVSQTGLPEIPIEDLLMVQEYYSLQMLQSVHERLLLNKFNAKDSLDDSREQALAHYLEIIERSVALLDQYGGGADSEHKSNDIRTKILEKVLQADFFSNLHLTQHVLKLLTRATISSQDGSETQGLA